MSDGAVTMVTAWLRGGYADFGSTVGDLRCVPVSPPLSPLLRVHHLHAYRSMCGGTPVGIPPSTGDNGDAVSKTPFLASRGQDWRNQGCHQADTMFRRSW